MSFRIELDKYEEAYGHFMREIHSAIQATFAQEAELRNLTQADLAQELNVDPSVISRRLSGGGNVTLRTICDLYTAMGREPLTNFLVQGSWTSDQSGHWSMNVFNNGDQVVVTAILGVGENFDVWQVKNEYDLSQISANSPLDSSSPPIRVSHRHRKSTAFFNSELNYA